MSLLLGKITYADGLLSLVNSKTERIYRGLTKLLHLQVALLPNQPPKPSGKTEEEAYPGFYS